MGFPAHLHGDLRTCGATTVVTGQSSVYVDGKLWAVHGDKNTHGEGALISASHVEIDGKKVIVHRPDNANEDNECPESNGEHCNPKTAQGSGSIFAD